MIGARWFSVTPAFRRRIPRLSIGAHRDGLAVCWHFGWAWRLLWIGTVTCGGLFEVCDARDPNLFSHWPIPRGGAK